MPCSGVLLTYNILYTFFSVSIVDFKLVNNCRDAQESVSTGECMSALYVHCKYGDWHSRCFFKHLSNFFVIQIKANSMLHCILQNIKVISLLMKAEY